MPGGAQTFCCECGKQSSSVAFCGECGSKKTRDQGPSVVNSMADIVPVVPPGGLPAAVAAPAPPPNVKIVRPEETALAELKALFGKMAGLDIHPDSFEYPAFQDWCGSLDIGLENPKATFDALDVDHSVDPQPWTLDPGPSTLDPGPWTLDPGPWTLNPGPWTL